MMQQKKQLDIAMTRANGIMTTRFGWIALAIVGVYFLSLTLDGITTQIAFWSANYVPAVKKLLDSEMVVATLSARFFGTSAVLLPFLVAWLLFGESPAMRAKYGAAKAGKTPTQFLFGIYLMGVPFGLAFLLLIFYSPIPVSPDANLWGEVLLNIMLQTPIGLLVFGTVLILSIVAIAAFTAMYLLLPVSVVVSNFSK